MIGAVPLLTVRWRRLTMPFGLEFTKLLTRQSHAWDRSIDRRASCEIHFSLSFVLTPNGRSAIPLRWRGFGHLCLCAAMCAGFDDCFLSGLLNGVTAHPHGGLEANRGESVIQGLLLIFQATTSGPWSGRASRLVHLRAYVRVGPAPFSRFTLAPFSRTH